jgi:transposase
MANFRSIDRETGFLLPPSVDEWLPQKHLARFVVEVIDGLDLRAMSGSYRGSGSASYHPRMLLGILVYGYATGCFRAGSGCLNSAPRKLSGFLPGYAECGASRF